MNLLAMVRSPGTSFVKAISNHPDRETIEFRTALKQHNEYVKSLRKSGIQVRTLPPLENFPDSVFIEDNAIILENKALLCSMKSSTRKGETDLTKKELEEFLKVEVLFSPVTIDGGDILQTEKVIFIGQSSRTNHNAVLELAKNSPKKIIPVEVNKDLHLKSSVSYLGNNTIVLNPKMVDDSHFNGFKKIIVDPKESYAANCLAIGDNVILPKGFPKLTETLSNQGWKPLPISMSEFEKADGGVTCLSLILPYPQ